jgi:hypothetical protein
LEKGQTSQVKKLTRFAILRFYDLTCFQWPIFCLYHSIKMLILYVLDREKKTGVEMCKGKLDQIMELSG